MPKSKNREIVIIGAPIVRRPPPELVLPELDARPLFTGSGADPASIVGLDAFIPGGDTATDGDPERTDPDPS